MVVPGEALIAADDRVGLRAFAIDDITAITQACNDPEITRWTSIPSPYTIELAELFVMLTDTWRREGSAFHFAIVDRDDGGFIGSVGLDSILRPPVLVGYWIAPWARRRGAATHALRLITHWAFTELDVESIDLITKTGNEPSEKVAINAGYTLRDGLTNPDAPAPPKARTLRRWVRARPDSPEQARDS